MLEVSSCLCDASHEHGWGKFKRYQLTPINNTHIKCYDNSEMGWKCGTTLDWPAGSSALEVAVRVTEAQLAARLRPEVI